MGHSRRTVLSTGLGLAGAGLLRAVAGARSRYHVRRRSVHARRRLGLSRAERRRALDAARAGAARAGRRHAGGARRRRLGGREPTSASQRRAPRHRLRDARLGAFGPRRGRRPRAARDYWYRFTSGGAQSPVGRTRTAAARGTLPNRMTLAVASCQHFEQGHYAAYRAIAADALDVVVHVGDYIYEGRGTSRVRTHDAPECHTLEDYRQRYAIYKSDPHLKAAHAAGPWMLVSDDHEVANDYAAEHSGQDDPPELFLARRAAAYQAYYEHLPLPRRLVPFDGRQRLYTSRASATSRPCSCSTAASTARRRPARRDRSSSRAPSSTRTSARCSATSQEQWLRRALGGEHGALEPARPADAARAFRSERRRPARLLGRRLERLPRRARAARRGAAGAARRESRRLRAATSTRSSSTTCTPWPRTTIRPSSRPSSSRARSAARKGGAGDVRSLAGREPERAARAQRLPRLRARRSRARAVARGARGRRRRRSRRLARRTCSPRSTSRAANPASRASTHAAAARLSHRRARKITAMTFRHHATGTRLSAFAPRRLVAVCAAFPSPSQETTPVTPIIPYPTETRTLPNGLNVIVVPMPSDGLAAYWSIVRTGSRDEYEPGRTGFAHFFEHMMFRGTERYPGRRLQPRHHDDRRRRERVHDRRPHGVPPRDGGRGPRAGHGPRERPLPEPLVRRRRVPDRGRRRLRRVPQVAHGPRVRALRAARRRRVRAPSVRPHDARLRARHRDHADAVRLLARVLQPLLPAREHRAVHRRRRDAGRRVCARREVLRRLAARLRAAADSHGARADGRAARRRPLRRPDAADRAGRLQAARATTRPTARASPRISSPTSRSARRARRTAGSCSTSKSSRISTRALRTTATRACSRSTRA